MPSDECLGVSGRKTQFFAAAHAGLRQIGETTIGKILKSALKNGQADDG
jgi:hypothetical protein